MDNISHLKSLIDSSELNEEDKGRWRNITASAPSIYIEQLVYFIEQVPQGLAWLNQNLKNKMEVLSQKDKGEWQNFLNKEEAEIKNLLNNSSN